MYQRFTFYMLIFPFLMLFGLQKANADATFSTSAVNCSSFTATGTVTSTYVAVRIWNLTIGQFEGSPALVDSYINVGAPTAYFPASGGAFSFTVNFPMQNTGNVIVARIYGTNSAAFGDWDGGTFPQVQVSCAIRTYPGAVPCNTTLQACVTGASAGDTIQLATNALIAEFVTVDKSLIIEPAPGFAPSVQALFAAVTTTSISLTVQNLAGLNTVRTDLAPGGGNLTLQVLNNKIDATNSRSAVEFTAGPGAPGTYGTATALVSGNRITMTGEIDSCADAVSITGITAGLTATVVNNDITVNDLSHCGGIVAVIGGGATASATIDRNFVHGANFDFGIEVRNFGNNPGFPGGLLTAQVSNNLVWGQNGNTGAPAGLVASADGYNAAIVVQLVNNTVADGRRGVLVSARTDLGANITGGLFNNIVAFNSQTGISIDTGLPGFSNSNNLTFGNGSEDFVAGPGTLTADPMFINRPAKNYRLTSGSPAVNTGLNSALPLSFTRDLAGAPRRVGVIDMGAYESVSPAVPGIIFMLLL